MRKLVRDWIGARLCLLGLGLLVSSCVCAPGEIYCSGRCANPESDRLACGWCGNTCAGECVRGSCVAPPPPPECASDWACDDGLACNGAERCDALGRCQSGTPPRCPDDGVACTVERCVDPAGSCESTPVDSACPMGQLCDAVTGCQVRCDQSPCGLLPQCGCPRGQACYPAALRCAPAGLAAPLEPCERTNDCEPGTSCLLVGTAALCARLCASGADCDPRRPYCFDSATAEQGVGYCAAVCDPVRQTGCPPGSSCTIFQTDAGAATLCSGQGTVPQDGSCTGTIDCAPGLICIIGSPTNRCSRQCYSTADCTGGRQCGQLMDPLRIDGRPVGACFL
ncbi:MAG: hypothetical protein IT378_10480 [Sandaracinaceae bacterium]|nr:hypothetical protein [Sandaracinaceae bacterium]